MVFTVCTLKISCGLHKNTRQFDSCCNIWNSCTILCGYLHSGQVNWFMQSFDIPFANLHCLQTSTTLKLLLSSNLYNFVVAFEKCPRNVVCLSTSPESAGSFSPVDLVVNFITSHCLCAHYFHYFSFWWFFFSWWLSHCGFVFIQKCQSLFHFTSILLNEFTMSDYEMIIDIS